MLVTLRCFPLWTLGFFFKDQPGNERDGSVSKGSAKPDNLSSNPGTYKGTGDTESLFSM